ncbi:M67 family metallopeptidase [Paenibacillus roseipurpureus]|uniref:M67 family metallopeptidase n=1 Tax=Paenibacillus roseopurpureus TaxID=2918901 RepID=A0AA96LM96_9BACL|nr:M67 family metallopeptidase [Paenibacillus sp. MBLB1832]WNR43181.1 M67 family metallopeptidase [Paenibacillus sp. MBLB1832]
MNVYLSDMLYDAIVAYSTEALPAEACGIIVGVNHGDHLQASKFFPLSNLAGDPAREFTINPLELLPYLQNDKQPVIGLFHSHPSAAAIPSERDLQTLWHTIPSYWILSLLKPSQPELAVYQLKKTITTTYHKLPLVRGQ